MVTDPVDQSTMIPVGRAVGQGQQQVLLRVGFMLMEIGRKATACPRFSGNLSDLAFRSCERAVRSLQFPLFEELCSDPGLVDFGQQFFLNGSRCTHPKFSPCVRIFAAGIILVAARTNWRRRVIMTSCLDIERVSHFL